MAKVEDFSGVIKVFNHLTKLMQKSILGRTFLRKWALQRSQETLPPAGLEEASFHEFCNWKNINPPTTTWTWKGSLSL